LLPVVIGPDVGNDAAIAGGTIKARATAVNRILKRKGYRKRFSSVSYAMRFAVEKEKIPEKFVLVGWSTHESFRSQSSVAA